MLCPRDYPRGTVSSLVAFQKKTSISTSKEGHLSGYATSDHKASGHDHHHYYEHDYDHDHGDEVHLSRCHMKILCPGR